LGIGIFHVHMRRRNEGETHHTFRRDERPVTREDVVTPFGGISNEHRGTTRCVTVELLAHLPFSTLRDLWKLRLQAVLKIVHWHDKGHPAFEREGIGHRPENELNAMPPVPEPNLRAVAGW
jgi:hypothetical protein